jgi:hypothetical protein
MRGGPYSEVVKRLLRVRLPTLVERLFFVKLAGVLFAWPKKVSSRLPFSSLLAG